MKIRHCFALATAAGLLLPQLQAQWQPAKGPLLTRWAKDVTPEKAHPEYPRPQMVRSEWLNLNGLWDYAIQAREQSAPAQYQGKILVPFPVESALSGVMKRVSEKDQLWYHRTFTVPTAWQGKRVLLHFGAVDFEASVTVNGRDLGKHTGGYDGFSFDVTDALKPSGEQEIVVGVWDPTDAGTQPRGKQVRRPEGIWYTPTSGIWQTAWLEPVNDSHVAAVKVTPDVDQGAVTVETHVSGSARAVKVKVTVLDGGKSVSEAELEDRVSDRGTSGPAKPRIMLKVPKAKLWSPDQPFLYDLKVTVTADGKVSDQLTSYFGMRKIALGKDAEGTLRLFLNNKALFQYGPLDQGFWPDGLYTAPTDEALRYDIEITKKLGFNMARKHVKIEPDRWYYWCDKLGLLVWQDMPSGDRYIGPNDPDIKRTEASAAQFELETKRLIDGRGNHPCIVMWVPFNEGWGQYDTPRITEWIKNYDPTRLVNNTSGWSDRRVGDVMDIHVYPGPGAPAIEEKRAGVLGEFGGLGLPVSGHTWQEEKNWGYRSFKTPQELTEAYIGLIEKLHPLTGLPGLSAAVYTQTTDVEVEVNGLMTYDRAIIKMDAERITKANQRLYTASQPRKQASQAIIPPATPLVACDPYFSIWSMADRLNQDVTRHWTGREQALGSLVRIDGKAFRIMGAEPSGIPALEQTDLKVLPTQTVYTFRGAGVEVKLTFLTPALPENLEVLSRPVTYLTWECKSIDGKPHQATVYFDSAAELTVNQPSQQVTWAQENLGDLAMLKVGSKDQVILGKKGDDLRIDWGYLYLAAPQKSVTGRTVASQESAQRTFAQEGKLPPMDTRMPRRANDQKPVAALTFELGKVGKKPVSRWMILAYDDIFSIQYFKKNLRPYWRRNGADAALLLTDSAREYASLVKRCAKFDQEMVADLTKVGGAKYATICVLAYRQCLAANKLAADSNGQPILFPKENFSNGCINTVDVIYPMAPQFLLLGPSLTKAMLVPIMDYANSPRWKFPFAPHDLGTYPMANGQVYGGGERTEENQMPVEETGNMLILLAALAQMEGNADFCTPYWSVLLRWADYLKAKGFDPENQLCTDDFAGHLAHNVNLSAKAIVALGAFGKICDMRGEKQLAVEYQNLAKEFAVRWVREAKDGDHYRLAFDRPGTWSQKYNLVWDRILGLGLFPAEVLRTEVDYYRKIQNRYGLSLDNRQPYTKLDWTIWTATLTQNREDFLAIVDPVYRFLEESTSRVPMSDWYWTKNGRQVGFQARSVVGGVFIQMLYDKTVWNKWAKRDTAKAAHWAPLPTPSVTSVLLPAANEKASTWRYTTTAPGADWAKPGFDAGSWAEGSSGFGTQGTPGSTVRTTWSTSDIWLRREVDLGSVDSSTLELLVHHDEDAEIYINGVLAANLTGYTSEYETVPILAEALKAIKPGRNLVAIHCHQTSGGQYIDLGFARSSAASKN